MPGQSLDSRGAVRSGVGIILLAGALLLSGCGGGGSGSDINLGPLPPVGGGADGGNNGMEFDPDTATLTLEGPDTVSPNSSNEYLATLVDENGTAPPGGGFFIAIQPTQGVVSPPGGGNTDAVGEVIFTYDAPNADTPRTERITARVTQGGVSLTERLEIMVTPDIFQFTSPANDSTLAPTPTTASPLEFQWVIGGEPADTGETPPAGGASQIMLTFDSNNGAQGGFTVNGAGPVNPAMVDVVDGAFAEPVGLLNEGVPGNAMISAQAAGGFETQLNLRYLGFADNVDLVANPVSIANAGASNLSATVRDSAGNLRRGITMRLFIESCAGGFAPPCINGETLLADTGDGQVVDDEIILTTDAGGQISAIYRAGTNAGGAVIRATVVEGSSRPNVTDSVAINVSP